MAKSKYWEMKTKTSRGIDAPVGVYAQEKQDEGVTMCVNMQDNGKDEDYLEPLPSPAKNKVTYSYNFATRGEIQPVPDPIPTTSDDVKQPVREKSFRSRTGSMYSKSDEIQYSVEDVPPWYLCMILGFQHYLVMFGATVTTPLVMASALCIEDNTLATSMLIGTTFVCCGFATLLQTILGIRLPIVQGAAFTLAASSLAILSLPHWKCPDAAKITPAPPVGVTMTTLSNGTTVNETMSWMDYEDEPLWKPRIREIQGAIMVASLFQVLIGFSGIMRFLLKCIGPLTIAPTISLVGLSLFEVATSYASKQWGIALATIVLIAMFSQYTKNIALPCFRFKRGQGCIKVNFPLFRLFSIILAVVITWLICLILTAAGVLSTNPDEPGYGANTNSRLSVFMEAPWFRVPYPGQWGVPTVSAAAVFGMLGGVLASMVESIGDYYACARIAQVPPPPMHAVNRGIGIQGIAGVIAGTFGSGNGTTSYSENIVAIGITKVASRRVIQTGAIFMLVMGMFGKFGALFVTIPDPIIGGVFIVMFGMITAVGISNLQFVDLNSSRNLFIIGFSFFLGLALPAYLYDYPEILRTGNDVCDQIILVLLRTSMFVGGLAGFVLDNTIPGTDEERGLIKWRKQLMKKHEPRSGSQHQPEVANVYEIPFLSKYLKRWSCTRFLPFLPTFDEELFTVKKKRRPGCCKNSPATSTEATHV